MEAPYNSVKASKLKGHNIVAGDEGGPVFNSKLNVEVSEATVEVAVVVGHESGKDAISVTDRVVLEPPDKEVGTHNTKGEGKIPILEEPNYHSVGSAE